MSFVTSNSLWFAQKCYLCSSNNNIAVLTASMFLVVICSKNVTFAVATTILWGSELSHLPVVICSKNVTFAVATTITYVSIFFAKSCDLLKKCYLCSSNNNVVSVLYNITYVVICSKNVTFAVATTIFLFKEVHRTGCDLLKKCYLCSSNNNLLGNIKPRFPLWFAQKMLPLQ